jgi:hypothetical protein
MTVPSLLLVATDFPATARHAARQRLHAGLPRQLKPSAHGLPSGRRVAVRALQAGGLVCDEISRVAEHEGVALVSLGTRGVGFLQRLVTFEDKLRFAAVDPAAIEHHRDKASSPTLLEHRQSATGELRPGSVTGQVSVECSADEMVYWRAP